MPADLRSPDFPDRPLADDGQRAARLEFLISQIAAQYREAVSLVAWDAENHRWCAWFDRKPKLPLPPHLDRPAFPDVLEQAGVDIGSDAPAPAARPII